MKDLPRNPHRRLRKEIAEAFDPTMAEVISILEGRLESVTARYHAQRVKRKPRYETMARYRHEMVVIQGMLRNYRTFKKEWSLI